MCLMPYANNKGADQPAHPRSLISTFVVCCLDSMLCILALAKISWLQLASVAEQAGLNLTWSKLSEDTFSHDVAHIWAATWQNQQNECAPIRPVWSVFAVRIKKHWVLSYPWAHCKDWSDWADLIWVFAGRTVISSWGSSHLSYLLHHRWTNVDLEANSFHKVFVLSRFFHDYQGHTRRLTNR